ASPAAARVLSGDRRTGGAILRRRESLHHGARPTRAGVGAGGNAGGSGEADGCMVPLPLPRAAKSSPPSPLALKSSPPIPLALKSSPPIPLSRRERGDEGQSPFAMHCTRLRCFGYQAQSRERYGFPWTRRADSRPPRRSRTR